jgi:hypothetical protein
MTLTGESRIIRENKLSQCYDVQQKSYSECPWIEHGPLMGQTRRLTASARVRPLEVCQID